MFVVDMTEFVFCLWAYYNKPDVRDKHEYYCYQLRSLHSVELGDAAIRGEEIKILEVCFKDLSNRYGVVFMEIFTGGSRNFRW